MKLANLYEINLTIDLSTPQLFIANSASPNAKRRAETRSESRKPPKPAWHLQLRFKPSILLHRNFKLLTFHWCGNAQLFANRALRVICSQYLALLVNSRRISCIETVERDCPFLYCGQEKLWGGDDSGYFHVTHRRGCVEVGSEPIEEQRTDQRRAANCSRQTV
jgi:hypothetical protein